MLDNSKEKEIKKERIITGLDSAVQVDLAIKTRCFTHTDPTYKLEPGVENRFFVVKYLSIIDTTSEEARATVARASSEVVSIMLQPLANASVSPRLTFEAFETLHA